MAENINLREDDSALSKKNVVILSSRGFVKRFPEAIFRSMYSRGEGFRGMGIREADAARCMVFAGIDDSLLFFTDQGKVYHLKCFEIPAAASRTLKGIAIADLFPVFEGERVTALLPVSGITPGRFLLMATEKGKIKKSSLDFLYSITGSGVRAIDLEGEDKLIAASQASDENDVILISQNGQSLRFSVNAFSKGTVQGSGVRGIRLEAEDKLVNMEVVIPGSFLLVVTASGYGTLNPIENYKTRERGGTGITALKVSGKTGKVIAARLVSKDQRMMLITKNGMFISAPVKDSDGGIPVIGTDAQGVLLIKMEEGDSIAALTAW